MIFFHNGIKCKEDLGCNYWFNVSIRKENRYILTYERFSGEKIIYHFSSLRSVGEHIFSRKYMTPINQEDFEEWKSSGKNPCDYEFKHHIYWTIDDNIIKIVEFKNGKWSTMGTI